MSKRSTRNPVEVERSVQAQNRVFVNRQPNIDQELHFLPDDTRRLLEEDDRTREAMLPSANIAEVTAFYDSNTQLYAERKEQVGKILEAQHKAEQSDWISKGGDPDEKKALDAKQTQEKQAVTKFFEKKTELATEHFKNIRRELESVSVIHARKAGPPGSVGAIAANQRERNGPLEVYYLPIEWDGLADKTKQVKLGRYDDAKTRYKENFLAGMTTSNWPSDWPRKFRHMITKREQPEVAFSYDPKTNEVSISREIYEQLGNMSGYRKNLLEKALSKGTPEEQFQGILALSQDTKKLSGRKEGYWAAVARLHLEKGHNPSELTSGMMIDEVMDGVEALLIHGKGMITLDKTMEQLNNGTLMCADKSGKLGIAPVHSPEYQKRLARLNKLHALVTKMKNEQESKLANIHQGAAQPVTDALERQRVIAAGSAEVENRATSLGASVKDARALQTELDQELNGASTDANTKAAYDELNPRKADGSLKGASELAAAGSLNKLESSMKTAVTNYSEQFDKIEKGREHAKAVIQESRKALDSLATLPNASVQEMQEMQERALNSLHSAIANLEALDKHRAALQEKYERLESVAGHHGLKATLKDDLAKLKTKAQDAKNPDHANLVNDARASGQQIANEARDFAVRHDSEIQANIAAGKTPVALRDPAQFAAAPAAPAAPIV